MRVAVNDIIIFCQKNNINKDINEIAVAIVDLLKSAPLLTTSKFILFRK
jgi:hypothetical protein